MSRRKVQWDSTVLAQVQKDEHELSSASLDGKKELIQEILKTKHW